MIKDQVEREQIKIDKIKIKINTVTRNVHRTLLQTQDCNKKEREEIHKNQEKIDGKLKNFTKK